MNSVQELPKELIEKISRARSDIPFFAKEFLGLELFPEQEYWLRHSNKLINILVPANRWGKTICTAIKHIHYLFFKIGLGAEVGAYKTLNVAPHSDISRVVFEYIQQIIAGKFSFRDPKTGKRRTNDSKISWFLPKEGVKETPYMTATCKNGAVFMSRSTAEDKGDGIQGRAFAYISYDEGCRSHHLDYEINANLLPRLMDLGGTLDITSTPDRESPSLTDYHALYTMGKEGIEDYYVQEGIIYENPFLDHKEIKRREAKTDEALKEQIFYGQFVFAASTQFEPWEIDSFFNKHVEFEDPKRGHYYIIGIDLASGEDHTVITVIDVTSEPYKVVHWRRFQGKSLPPQAQFQIIRDIHTNYSKGASIDAILDSTSMGGQFAASFLSDIITKNVPFTQSSKKGLISNLKDLLGREKIKSPEIKELRKELLLYRTDDRKLTTDSVMSLALACLGVIDYQLPAPYESRTLI